MTDYAALKAEIAKPDYAGMTDDQIAAALNASESVIVDVATSSVRGAFLASPDGDWAKIILVAEGREPAPANVVALAITARDTLNNTAMMQASDPAKWVVMQATMAGLVAAGLATQKTADAVLAMAVSKTTWAIDHGWPQGMNAGEIAAARLFND